MGEYIAISTLLVIIASLWLAGALALLVWHDLRDHRLPDRYTLSLIATGLIYNAYLARALPWDALFGAILGFGVFWLIGVIYFRLRTAEGLGLGDAKLLAGAGAWLGATGLPLLVLMAALGALLFSFRRPGPRDRPIAFGPWLAAAFWGLWLIGIAVP